MYNTNCFGKQLKLKGKEWDDKTRIIVTHVQSDAFPCVHTYNLLVPNDRMYTCGTFQRLNNFKPKKTLVGWNNAGSASQRNPTVTTKNKKPHELLVWTQKPKRTKSLLTPLTMSYTATMQQGPNIRSNDVRYRRIGSETPYRDDPVRLWYYTSFLKFWKKNSIFLTCSFFFSLSLFCFCWFSCRMLLCI